MPPREIEANARKADWAALLAAGEVAIAGFDIKNGLPRTPDGKRTTAAEQTCLIFPSKKEAQAFARAQAKAHQGTGFELYDERGRRSRVFHKPTVFVLAGTFWGLVLFILAGVWAVGALLVAGVIHLRGWESPLAGGPGPKVAFFALSLIVGLVMLYGIGRLWCWWNYGPVFMPKETDALPEKGEFLNKVGKLGAAKLPTTIDLEPFPDHLWSDPERYARLSEGIRQQGFAEGGIYRIPQVSHLRAMQYFRNPELGIYAIISDHRHVGIFHEFICRFDDGTSITCCAREGHGFDQWEKHPNLYFGDIPPSDLLQRMLEQRPPMTPIHFENDDQLISAFRQYWSDYKQWTMTRGRTPAEVQRIYDKWRERTGKEIKFKE